MLKQYITILKKIFSRDMKGCLMSVSYTHLDVYKRQALSDITYEYDCIFEKLVEELQPYDFVVNCRGCLLYTSRCV